MKRLAASLLLLVGLSMPAHAVAGDGWASEYRAGHGVAMPFCTWTLRHTEGCGWVRIQSLQTGIVVVVPVVDYCYCVVPDSPRPYRVVDLEYGVRDALGLDPSLGMWRVSVERVDGGSGLPVTLLPDTSVAP